MKSPSIFAPINTCFLFSDLVEDYQMDVQELSEKDLEAFRLNERPDNSAQTIQRAEVVARHVAEVHAVALPQGGRITIEHRAALARGKITLDQLNFK